MRTPVIAGNWKMNNCVQESIKFIKTALPMIEGILGVEIILCPPFTALHAINKMVFNTSLKLKLSDDICIDSYKNVV